MTTPLTTPGEKATVLSVYVPKLFPTHSIHDKIIVEKWYVEEGDIIQPDQDFVSLETPPAYFDVPPPPEVTGPCRVVSLPVPAGGVLQLGDLLIQLEPVAAETNEVAHS
jgi:pyruvate/2-oxoglutarate dehydrogenase complex dihydrolipoamide acyltransferase (E2) component